MQHRGLVVPAARVDAGVGLQRGPVPVRVEHLEPGILGMAVEMLGHHPGDAFGTFLAGIMEDIAARSLEAAPPFVDARHHRTGPA